MGEGREYTLELAKKVNSYQNSIKQKTKKMMATLSELSVVQATAIKLQNDVQEVSVVVDQAQVSAISLHTHAHTHTHTVIGSPLAGSHAYGSGRATPFRLLIQ